MKLGMRGGGVVGGQGNKGDAVSVIVSYLTWW